MFSIGGRSNTKIFRHGVATRRPYPVPVLKEDIAWYADGVWAAGKCVQEQSVREKMQKYW